MGHLQLYQVFSNLPEPLGFPEVLSHDLWWCRQRDVIGLFRRIDPRIWKASGRNPIVFLTNIPQKRTEEPAEDESFPARLKRVEDRFRKQISLYIRIGPD